MARDALRLSKRELNSIFLGRVLPIFKGHPYNSKFKEGLRPRGVFILSFWGRKDCLIRVFGLLTWVQACHLWYPYWPS
jgi:hypothetical protein